MPPRSTPPIRTAATSPPSTVSLIRLEPSRTQSLPSGFNAFNVQNLNGTLFVTYANPNNPLGGVVDEYTTDGKFIKRLITDAAGSILIRPGGSPSRPRVGASLAAICSSATTTVTAQSTPTLSAGYGKDSSR